MQPRNIVARISGDVNVSTLGTVRQALMAARLDLNRLDRAIETKTESEMALLRHIQEVIADSCSKLSILEGELTNAGIQ